MWRPAVLFCAVAFAGCGGEEPREALKGWSRTVDADCRKAAAGVAAVPRPPVSVGELAEVAPAVAGTFDEAARRIERRKLPEAARPLARPFLRELEAARAEFRRLGDAAKHRDTTGTSASVKKMAALLPRLERSAARAGVRRCGDRRGMTAILDGVRGAIFVHFFPQITRDAQVTTAEVLSDLEGSSIRKQSDSIGDAGLALDDAHTRISGLDPPTWADKTIDEYLSDLEDVNGALFAISDALDSLALRALPRANVRRDLLRAERELGKAIRAEERAAIKLDRLIRERLLEPDPAAGAIGSLA
jgi:hypothetical protein